LLTGVAFQQQLGTGFTLGSAFPDGNSGTAAPLFAPRAANRESDGTPAAEPAGKRQTHKRPQRQTLRPPCDFR
jgi:hypothetical protein